MLLAATGRRGGCSQQHRTQLETRLGSVTHGRLQRHLPFFVRSSWLALELEAVLICAWSGISGEISADKPSVAIAVMG